MKKDLTFIDLFCGCGGLSLGFEMAGYKSILAIDCWKDALETYAYNRPESRTLCADLSTASPDGIKAKYGIKSVDVIIGGPPCQGFSIAGKRIIEDERNKLYKSFVNFVGIFRPKAFVMENVPNILSMGNGVVKESILSDFKSLGYEVRHQVLTASDYGVPQNRKRAVFVGLAQGKMFEFPKPFKSERITSFEALSDLPEQSIADGSTYPTITKSDYQIWARTDNNQIFNHEITVHNQRTVEIISMVPDGGNYKNLPVDLQSTRKVHIAWTRLNSNKPSFTIDCGHRHHFHYCYNRIPTVREAARIQSFPDKFVFLKSRTSQYKQVGNAVPPLMAKAIAEQLKDLL
ncbi:DNA cytosine methyltransferase [Muribaculum sp.]|jgi:DNA (cytosine-5)-methyltransferase 1|uniref:DNA cytosine methyltransferase n=1 Tax=Muribaculum sp. TaxID=1918611 RepID=UPI00257E0EBF|nr:DNA cytosine methyltransferase [Muribaculum sp.]